MNRAFPGTTRSNTAGRIARALWDAFLSQCDEGDTICTVTDHFSREEDVVRAPCDGLLIGVLENPVALPGHPLCHLVCVDRATHAEVQKEVESGEFDGYHANGTVWRASEEQG